jgi:Zn-dependent protease
VISDNQLLDTVLFIALLVPGVILHEVAHGWVAERLGDPTARRAHRITLNPFRHIDPFGSLLMPAMLALAGQPVWGWARPVPVDPRFFRHSTRGMALVSLAGPAANLSLAAVAARLGPLVDLQAPGAKWSAVMVSSLGIGITTSALWGRLVFAFVVVNVSLAIFNLLPIPPLDGSRLLPLVLTERGRERYDRLAPFGFLVLFLLVFVFEGALSFVGRLVGSVMRLVV